MHFNSIAHAAEFGEMARQYQTLRRANPTLRAQTIKRYLGDDCGLPLAVFVCETERGHTWNFTGTAYGGDDSSYSGEGRCYCTNCGHDGDA